MTSETVYFAQISDTHFGPGADYERHGYRPLPHAECLIDILNNLPQRPDFVIHTGDVVTDPDPIAYRIAAETFSKLQIPIYYTVGNHDTARDIRKYMVMGPKEELSDDLDLLSYAFSVRGERFLVLDARAPDNMDPLGLLSPAQLSIARRELTAAGPPLTVFIHYPLFPLNSDWMDRHMPIVNGYDLHELLLNARDRLRGVFHGHIHQHMQTLRDGISYTAVASTFANFRAWPDDSYVQSVADPPGYNFVHLLPRQTIIHQHSFPHVSTP